LGNLHNNPAPVSSGEFSSPEKFSPKNGSLSGSKEGKVKKVILMLICLTLAAFSAERLNPERGIRNIIMTDEAGLPLDDGIYNVEFKIYDTNRGGNLIETFTSRVESKDGICQMCTEKIGEMEKKGYKEVWVALKIENYPETKFRTRIFTDTVR
jgi:hypothetical protein